MRFASITVLSALGASLAAALPTELSQFFLVTSDQSNPSANSSSLKGVKATTPFVRSHLSTLSFYRLTLSRPKIPSPNPHSSSALSTRATPPFPTSRSPTACSPP